MTLRYLAGLLTVAGLVVNFGLAAPARVRVGVVQQAAAEAHREQQLLRSRMRAAKGGGAVRVAIQGLPGKGETEPQFASLRRRTSLVLTSVPTVDPRVQVRSSKEAGLVDVQVTATGRFQDLARVATLLVEHDVALETVTFTSTAGDVRVEIAGQGVEVGP